MLTRDPRRRGLPQERIGMAIRAMMGVDDRLARGGQGGVRVWTRRRHAGQRGVIGAEVANILVGDIGDYRVHVLVVTASAAIEDQLPLEE